MNAFRTDGHLTDEILLALAGDGIPDELTRLEVAEHLAFCDECLQRYTEFMDAMPLLTPAHSCEQSLWTRIRMKAVQAFTSRYATAAAAVFLALTALWGGTPGKAVHSALPADRPAITECISDSLSQAMSGLSSFLDGFREY